MLFRNCLCCIPILVVVFGTNAREAFADHGGCPCAAENPAGDAPSEILEPSQRAVILWNGQTEVLVLSTDLALTEGGEKSAVEFIPLPSQPSIRAESKEMLKRVDAWAATQQIDVPHFASSLEPGSFRGEPFFTPIAQPSELAERLTQVCAFDARIQSNVTEIAASYLHRGFAWFAVDQVDIDTTVRSFPPMRYTFASDRLYYPLETSSMAAGNSRIELILITPSGISDLGSEAHPIAGGPAIAVSTRSLGQIDADWPGLFSPDNVVVQHVAIDGVLRDVHFDLLSKEEGKKLPQR